MAKVDLAAAAEQLFVDFMAPLVLGGDMRPARPLGGRAALAIGKDRTVGNVDRHAHVQLARIRVARRLLPIDRLPDATPDEWSLAACLHDLVQSTHPGLDGIFRAGSSERLTAIVRETLGRIPKPRTPRESLSRHTWFSRLFEITRRDTTVSWWIGSRAFLGTPPAAHLMTWPDLRRVRVRKIDTRLVSLAKRDTEREDLVEGTFERTLTAFLHHAPLTDLGTLTRTVPAFTWSRSNLDLLTTRAGRTMTARALRALPEPQVASVLGRATRLLVVAETWRDVLIAMSLLGDLALAHAQTLAFGNTERIPQSNEAARATSQNEIEQQAFARAAGAIAACERLRLEEETFSPLERSTLRARLEPLCEGRIGRDLKVALSPYSHFFPSFFANAAFSGASSKTSILV